MGRHSQFWWGVMRTASVYRWEQYSIASPVWVICIYSHFPRINSSCIARSPDHCLYTWLMWYTLKQDVLDPAIRAALSMEHSLQQQQQQHMRHVDKHYTMQTAVLYIGIYKHLDLDIYDMSIRRISLMMNSCALGCAIRPMLSAWWRVLKHTVG